MRAWRLARWAVRAAVLALPAMAAAQDRPAALVVGIGADGCEAAARGVAARLAAQGITARVVLSPGSVALRSAIDDFAASFNTPQPAKGLAYLCGPVAVLGARVFVLPPGVTARDAPAQGVILQALPNAMAGAGGTVYADLSPGAAPAPGDWASTVRTMAERLTPGVNLALALRRPGEDGVGARLASPAFSVDAPWDAIAAGLADSLPAGRISLVPPPAAPPPAATPPAATPAPPVAAPEPAPEGTATLEAASPAAPPPAPALKPKPAPSLRRPPRPAPPVREPPPHEPADGRTERLQRALAAHGLYPGPITGRADAATRYGIRTFQRRLHEPETGVLTESEIVRLLNE